MLRRAGTTHVCARVGPDSQSHIKCRPAPHQTSHLTPSNTIRTPTSPTGVPAALLSFAHWKVESAVLVGARMGVWVTDGRSVLVSGAPTDVLMGSIHPHVPGTHPCPSTASTCRCMHCCQHSTAPQTHTPRVECGAGTCDMLMRQQFTPRHCSVTSSISIQSKQRKVD